MKQLMPISILVCLIVVASAQGDLNEAHGPTEYNMDAWWQLAIHMMAPDNRETYCESIETAKTNSFYEDSMKSLWNLARSSEYRGSSYLKEDFNFAEFMSSIGFRLGTSDNGREYVDNKIYNFLSKYFNAFDHDDDDKIDYDEFKSIITCFASTEAVLLVTHTKLNNDDTDTYDGDIMLRNFEKELKRSYDKGLISQELIEELTRQLKPATKTNPEAGEARATVMKRMSIKEIAVFQIVIWDIIGTYFDTLKHYQLLGNKHCVPNSAFLQNILGGYKDRISAMKDCDKNKKCAMINNQGCIEDGNGVFQMCTGMFRDLRGKIRRQPLPSPKDCVLQKVK